MPCRCENKNMKKKLTACFLAAMLLMTGCGGSHDTDLSKRYPEFFRYTFGSDYRFKFSEHVKGDYPYDVYYLSYGDKHEPLLPESRVEITPYENSMASADRTEEEYYLSYLELLVEEEITDIFRLDFPGIIKPHFGLSLSKDSNGILTFGDGCKDGSILITVLPVFNVDHENAAYRELAAKLYQPDTGLKICAQSMESLAQNDQFIVTVLIRLSADVSPAQYTDKFKAVAEDYLALNPQNYTLILKQKGEDGSGDKTLDLACGILGEPIDYEAHAEAHGNGYVFADDVREAWLAKNQK